MLAALVHAQVGGFLAHPPGLDGESGLGLAGVHGVPRPRTWDAVASAQAPELPGDTATFVVLEDGTIVVDDDLPDGSLAPLADAVEVLLDPPYRAAAIRREDAVWSVVAEAVAIAEISRLEGDVIDLTIFDGARELSVDGQRTIRHLEALDPFVEAHPSVALHAERVDGDLFAVDVFAL